MQAYKPTLSLSKFEAAPAKGYLFVILVVYVNWEADVRQ